MNASPTVCVLGHACLIDGEWLGGDQEKADPRSDAVLGSQRIARADRLTRLAAACTARATQGLAPVAADRLATVGGTVLASLRVNASYEQRRHRTGRAAPRQFPRTAPNAWLGEIAIALDARGPSLCLVGDGGVAAMAIATAARWLRAKTCDRAIVIAAESAPDDTQWLPVDWHGCSDGAAALVLAREGSNATGTIQVEATSADPDPRDTSSLDVMSRLVQCLQVGGERRIEAPSRVGVGWSMIVRI